ncbi:MAG: hypothetical protein CMO55_08000 [Verrucomicrobiales bacterium]|nr:hypothetical protein [Verrucomicrobiales bacterium]
MDRSSKAEARTIFDAQLPQVEDSERVLNFYADAVEFAHARNPAGWGITLHEDRIRLNVGRWAVGTLERKGYWICLHREAISEALRKILDESPHWRWAKESDYAALPTDDGYCTAATGDVELWAALREPHFALIEAAAEKWGQLRSQSRKAHSPGALRLLEELSRRALPRPEFDPVESVDNLERELTELPDFDPANIQDGRLTEIGNIVRRRGQPAFRRQLLEAYGNRCAISGCDVSETLEAAHILPYSGPETNHPANGLLLRSDIHALFDLGRITIDPETMTVEVDPALVGTEYEQFHGKELPEPCEQSAAPNREALKRHRENRGLLRSE